MAVSAKRNARIEISASARGVAPGVNDARRQLRMMDRERAKAAKDAERDAARQRKQAAAMASTVSGGVKTGFGALLGLDAAGGVMGLVGGFRDVEKEMTRFQIDAQLSEDQMSAFRAEVMRVSNATGVSREQLVQGAHAYQILTGDADGAREAVSLFAKVALASGASMDDIAAVAGAMRMNAKLAPKDFQKGFDVLLSMGHKGSVELRDFAGEVARLMPMVENFGDAAPMDKWTEMAAIIQGVRKDFGDVNQAATGFSQLMNRLSNTKVVERLADHGVMVWRIDPKTGLHMRRDLMDILADIKKKIPDPKILGDVMGGRLEASRALNAIEEHWDEIIALRKEAEGSNQVEKDAATYLASPTGKIERAMERVKNAIANALTPERVEAFANAVEGLVEHLQPLIEALGQIGGLVGGLYSIGKSVRGMMPGGNGHTAYSGDDLTYTSDADQYQQTRTLMLQNGMSPAEMAAHKNQALMNMAAVDARNAAVDSIMGAERDDRSTPESIKAALAAKYADGLDRVGGTMRSAYGAEYLRDSGSPDLVDRETTRIREMATAASMQAITNAIAIGFAAVKINMDGHAVGKGVANAPGGATRPGRR